MTRELQAQVGDDLIPDDAIVVRPSSFSTWAHCQLAVQHSLLHPLYDDRPSQQASFGTFVHKLHELFINDEPVPVTVEGALDLWDKTSLEGDDLSIYDTGATDKSLRAWATEALLAHGLWVEQYWEPVGSQADIVGTELTMSMFLGEAPSGREVWLRGTADLIEPTRGADWKTSSGGWPDNRVDTQGQHLCYTAMARAAELSEPEEFSYVIYNRKEKTWEWSATTVPVSPYQEEITLREMFKMGVVIDAEAAMGQPSKTGAFWGHDGRGWWCSPKWCGAWSICEAKYLLDDGQADEIRDGLITWKK